MRVKIVCKMSLKIYLVFCALFFNVPNSLQLRDRDNQVIDMLSNLLLVLGKDKSFVDFGNREKNYGKDHEAPFENFKGKTYRKSPAHSNTVFICPGFELYVNLADCGTYFNCQNGVPLTMTCLKGMHFNENSQVCERPSKDTCKPASSIHQISSPSPLPSPSPTYSSAPSNGVFICPGFKLYTNLADCGTYFNCQEGAPVTVTCLKGLQFNENRQVCERPSKDTCKPASSIHQISSPSPLPSPSPTYSSAPSNDVFICPGFKLYANLADCGTYFNCQEGAPVTVTCLKGLQFNENRQVCERPSKDTCKPASSIHQISSPSPLPSPSPTYSSAPSNDVFICPGFKLYPNLADCGTYFNCQEGEPVTVTCPTGMQFNEKRQVCDCPSKDTCKPASSSIYPISPSPSPLPCPLPSSPSPLPSPTYSAFECPGTMSYVNIDDCGTFFNCQTRKPVLKNCPTGLQFNEGTQVCDWPSTETCKPTPNVEGLYDM